MDNRRNNKFYEEEVDDDEFLRHPKSGTSGYLLPGVQPNSSTKPTTQPNNAFNQQQAKNSQNQDLEKQRQLLIDRRREIEERTLASSERGLGLLYESEKVGVATADELSRQKEQLMRTEQRLDDINSTLRNSEKHIQGIRSVFGAVRNYFGGDTSLSQGGSVLMLIQIGIFITRVNHFLFPFSNLIEFRCSSGRSTAPPPPAIAGPMKPDPQQSAARVPVSSAGSIGLQQQQQSQRYLFHIIDISFSCPSDIKKPTLVSETSLVLSKPLQQAWTMLWIEILMTWPQDCQG